MICPTLDGGFLGGSDQRLKPSIRQQMSRHSSESSRRIWPMFPERRFRE